MVHSGLETIMTAMRSAAKIAGDVLPALACVLLPGVPHDAWCDFCNGFLAFLVPLSVDTHLRQSAWSLEHTVLLLLES